MNVCHHAVMFSFPKTENCKDLPAALLSFHQEKTHHAKKKPPGFNIIQEINHFCHSKTTDHPPTQGLSSDEGRVTESISSEVQ